jgi:DNA-binding MarR family transcriptional regulator
MRSAERRNDITRKAPSVAKLDDQLCFSIYAASRALTQTYRSLLSDLDLTYPQYLVMLSLWESSPTTVGGLCKRLALDFGTLTPLLKRLESRGLLARERSGRDEREVHVTLTETGGALQKKAADVPNQLRCRITLPRSDTAFLRDAMKTILKDLTK